MPNLIFITVSLLMSTVFDVGHIMSFLICVVYSASEWHTHLTALTPSQSHELERIDFLSFFCDLDHQSTSSTKNQFLSNASLSDTFRTLAIKHTNASRLCAAQHTDNA
jgi:hypothetical protein